MDERLPFPIHGTRIADGAPAQAAGDAARLLYFTNLIASTAGVPVFSMRQSTPYGEVTASVHGTLAFKGAQAYEKPKEEPQEKTSAAPRPPATFTRLVWLPEGFVITPRTPGAPDGFGMPPTPDGRGTPGGPLKQVIINRFEGNQYPDAVYRHVGGKDASAVVAANLFFMDWELDKNGEFSIGYTTEDSDGKKQFFPQFDKRWVPLYREPDSGKWHCHRPTPAAESAQQLRMRVETNLLREEVGLPPFGAMLRGRNGWLSSDAIYQMRYSGIYGHGSRKFREGHQEFFDRTVRDGWQSYYNENLMFKQGHDPESVDFAVTAVAAWRSSPPHYGAIIEDNSEGGVDYESVESWAGGAVFTAMQPPPYALDTPTIPTNNPTAESAVMAQIIEGTDAFVFAAPGTHSGRAPVGIYAQPLNTLCNQDMLHNIYPHGSGDVIAGVYLTYRGRLITTSDPASWREFLPLSATTVVESGAEVALRMAMLLRPNTGLGPAYLVVYGGAIHNFMATKVELGRFLLPSNDAGDISVPTWSASGAKMAFCYTTIRPAPLGRIGGPSSGAHLPNSFVGQQLHFVEFDGVAFIDHGTDSLKVDPSDFSGSHQNMTCLGVARYLPTYSGEALDYVRVQVDSYVRCSVNVYEKRIHGALVFPDGTEIVYSDLHYRDEFADNGHGFVVAPLAGFVRHILPFDVNDPESVAYIQYDHPTDLEDLGISAKLIIRGALVKYSPLAYDDGIANGPRRRQFFVFQFGVYHTLDAFRGNPYQTIQDAGGGFGVFVSYGAGLGASAPFDGLVISDSNLNAPSYLPIGPEDSYRGPHPSRPYATDYVLVGPTLLRTGRKRVERLWSDSPSSAKIFDRIEMFSYASYKGDWIYSGRIENTLGGTGEYLAYEYQPSKRRIIQRSAWLGDDQYYCHSSLDLKALTGLPDLKDNIMPIGVL